MANTETSKQAPARGKHLSTNVLLGMLALLAPLSYFAGRVSTAALANTYFEFIAAGIANGALGVMIGIPIGLFFGSLRRSGGTHATSVNTRAMERTILDEIRRELAEDKALYDARKGSTVMFARIAYLTGFWSTIKASGRLFVMQDAQLLNTLATAYYWLDQATHLETLAYEAKYAHPDEGDHATAEQLITEARLLDGQLETSLDNALSAIDSRLADQ